MIDFLEFDRRCRSEWRFAADRDCRHFLRTLVRSAAERVRLLTTDDPLWRAQLDSDEEESPPLDESGSTMSVSVAYAADRMRPNARRAGEGRLSCRGIPVLYLATDAKTAISEVRPHVGAEVSISRFRVARELRVVDCASGHDIDPIRFVFDEAPSLESVWTLLSHQMATPLYDLGATEQYASAQIIAEHFRRAGYDGVEFKTSLGPGRNVALFDADAACAVSGDVVRVKGMDIEVELLPPPVARSWRRQAPPGAADG